MAPRKSSVLRSRSRTGARKPADGEAARLQRLVVPGIQPPTPHQRQRLRRREQEREAILKAFERKGAAAGFSVEELRRYMDRLSIVSIPAGGRIDSQGDRRDFVSVVGTGCVKTVVNPPVLDPTTEGIAQSITVQFAKPTFVFGLAPVATADAPDSFGAVAHVDSNVVVVRRDLMREIIANTPAAGRLQLVAYHARGMSRLIYEKCVLAPLDVKQRLLRALGQLARAFPLAGSPGEIDLPLTHQDLAELVGASRYTVLRALADLSGEVAVTRNRYALAKRLVARSVASAGRSASRRAPTVVAFRKRAPGAPRWTMNWLGLPRRIADLLVAGAQITTYEEGERIASGDRLHASVLWSGAARVMVATGDGHSVGAWIAKPGHFIGVGWGGERADHARAFSAIALERSEVAILKESVMLDALGVSSADDVLRFLGSLHMALSRQLYDRCVTLSLGNTERLLYQLARLASDFPARHPRGVEIALRLNPSRDVAPMVSMSRTVFSRAFSALRASRRLEVDGDGKLVVRRAHAIS